MNAPASANERTYDLFFQAGKPRFRFVKPGSQISLSDERIGWTHDGQFDGAPYASIAEVHLESGGSWHSAIGQCRITFADGYRITVLDGDRYRSAGNAGLPDYRDFVRDLHARLAASGRHPTRHTAGYTGARYNVVLACAILLGIIGVLLPFVLLVMTGKLQVLWLLVAGISFCWPLVRMLQANAPRDYDPAHPPEELLG